jgi:phosphatidylserine decarboxylase
MEYNLLLTEGHYILLALVLLGLLGFIIPSRVVTVCALVGFFFSWYFFRNPTRRCEAAEHNIYALVCPADGQIIDIEDVIDPFVGKACRISIFLSPFDVHVQWSPVESVISQINYRPGKFIVAYAPKSSDVNECNELCLITKHGAKIVVRQIAGFIARRICCWVAAGESLRAGQKYGMIRFGSRVDVVVPRTAAIAVHHNERVIGGQTMLGILAT